MNRKKLNRSKNAVKKETIECVKCKKHKVLGSFYNSNSTFNIKGKAPICKPCISKLVDINNMETVYKMLKDMDVKFDQESWDKAVKSEKETFGRYLSIINGLPQHRGSGWEDNTAELKQNHSLDTTKNDNRLEISDELREKWGEGYKPEEYLAFERKFNYLSKNYDEKTVLHTENLKNYCRYQIKAEYATASGQVEDAKKWAELANKAATAAKLNVSQLSKSDISGGVELISQLFEAVESEVGIIPLLPKLREQPYDDADMIIWSMVNYVRRLEEKPRVAYRDIYNFYDEMIEEHCRAIGMSDEEIKEYKAKRNNVFRDLEQVYVEPLYKEGGDE